MGSKGRLPPHHLRRPLPGPGIGHHDSFAPEMHPQHGGFSPFDMLPRPDIMEQKLAAQHVEMQKLATENQRFAATHGNLRQDLAAIQNELQMLHNHVGAVKSEREQQIMGLLDKIGKMEADLHGAEALKLELHQARTDAQSLLSAREELASRVQQLTEDRQRVHMDLQQVPALMSELDGLRQEYQHCRATYEYEKKLYNEHLESLQVMEKNYMTMATEVEKLRAELKKNADVDRRTAGPYPGFPGYNDKEASGHYPVGQNTYDDTYGAPQGRAQLPGGGGGAAAAEGNIPVGAQPGASAARAGYDAYRGSGPVGSGYDVQRGPGPAGSGYDVHKGPSAPAYDPQRGPGGPAYDSHRGPAYDSQRGPGGPGYDAYRGPGGSGYDMQRGPVYDPRRGSNPNPDGQRGAGGGPGYEAHRGSSFESPGQQGNNASYGGSMAATSHGGGSGFQGGPPTADGNRLARR